MMKRSSNTSSTTSNSKMAETPNIKVVRLQSGEDVIADILSDNDNTILHNPMVVLLKRSGKGSVMMMVPWLPVELISDNIATVNNSEIVTYTNPKDSLVEYYLNMVHEIGKEIQYSDEMIKQQNKAYKGNLDSETYADDYDEDISTMDELLDKFNIPKDKKRIH